MAQVRKTILKKARIEIIPLIDVIFFLLATFVLFTLSLDRIQSIPIDLPKTQFVKPDVMPDIVTIQVSDQGTLYWNREIISKDELMPRLVEYKRSEPDPRVLIAGDNKAEFGPTMEVLDAVRLAQIEKVSVETRTRETGR